MANFDVKCPDHYPENCRLSPADKECLETSHKYKAFFIFQYKNNDPYLEPVLEKFFNNRTWRLFNAGKETGSGTKFCNVCRYALASDFGIACLTPLNHNVFQEIGLMTGLQKPLLYLYNPNQCQENLPFDISDQIYIEYKSQEELELRLEKNINFLIEKVELYSRFEKRFRESLQQKVDNLPPKEREMLELFLIENRPLNYNFFIVNGLEGEFNSWKIVGKTNPLVDFGLMIENGDAWETNPEYRDILREIVFKKKDLETGI